MMKKPSTRAAKSYVWISALCSVAMALPAAAEAPSPAFAGIFSDHAVLQRDTPVRLWGTAQPSHTLTLTVGGQTQRVTSGSDGKWQAQLSPLKSGGPYSLSLRDDQGGAEAILNDIMVGDVWFCSGQSNMEYLTKYATGAEWEVMRSQNDALRFVTVERDASSKPLDDLKTRVNWHAASPTSTGNSSAVCYFMGRALQKSENVPIGLIQSSWGGTLAQTWMSDQGLRSLKDYDIYLDALKRYSQAPDKALNIWSDIATKWWEENEPDAKTKRKWIAPGYDDSGWEDLTANGMWEESGQADLAAFDGVVYLRTTFDLTAAQAKAGTRINLGPIDDSDTTWVNGVYVGGMDLWERPRTYDLPKGVLKTGKNVITVRVLDTGGGGGLRGKPEERTLELSDSTKIALPLRWRYRLSTAIENLGTPPTSPWQVPNGLTMLYNAMIAPITRYNIKGVAWYQGEANTDNPKAYARLLPALITDWRTQFQHKDMPFLIVQLANFGPSAPLKSGQSPWAEVREVQRQMALKDPNVGLAVTVDIGDRFDIHPSQKNVVGLRLASAARAIAYGETVTWRGPEPVGVTRSGTDLIVSFKNTGGALRTYSALNAIGFEVCDAKDQCQYVTATPDKDTIVLKDTNSVTAVKVRYAWANAPYVNLYSADDLPAVPFELSIEP